MPLRTVIRTVICRSAGWTWVRSKAGLTIRANCFGYEDYGYPQGGAGKDSGAADGRSKDHLRCAAGRDARADGKSWRWAGRASTTYANCSAAVINFVAQTEC